jgi:carbon starvation protein
MLLLVLGVIVWHPDIAAPLVSAHPSGAPQFIPFLFIIIACGAISGFHSLVASGTTSKQLSNEVDARPIAYGGMLLEGFLAVLVILACTAGLGDESAWNARYISWEAASGLEAKIGAFIDGGASFLTHLGIGKDFALGILGVMVASFAGTTLDTSARIQRYVVSELAQEYRLRPLSTRYGATLFAVLTAGLLSFARGGGKGALLLWPLFGTTNQLLAGLVLLTITVYLLKKGRPLIYTLIPMLFMLIVATWALVLNVKSFLDGGDLFLATLGIVFFLLALWMIGEAIRVYRGLERGGVAA